jgi:valyl-tRNA synthetase
VEYKETEGDLYFIRYPLSSGGYVTVATTRPETMLGDVALAINPKDERNFHLIGKIAILPILQRELPIIVDQRVDPKFGTGILKVTPAHSLIDYEIGLRHGLSMISVIDENAKMNENAGEFQGLDYLTAREKIVPDFKSLV